MKGGQSAARQHRRAMKKAGIAVAVREVAHDSSTGNLALIVEALLYRLEREGADMSSRIAITIGDDHPNFPGRTVVEAKAAASKPKRCQYVHDFGGPRAGARSVCLKCGMTMDEWIESRKLNLKPDGVHLPVYDPDRDDAGS